MNKTDKKYGNIELVNEMLETPEIIRNFDHQSSAVFAEKLISKQGLFLTGEGSSRIFPAKRLINYVLMHGLPLFVFSEGSTQALEFDLHNFGVFGASNSGQTKELVRLFDKLKNTGHNSFFGLTANTGTILEELAISTHILSCGKEKAVAASKSVMEQALFYDSLVRNMMKTEMEKPGRLAQQVEEVLTMSIDTEIIDLLKDAGIIYFAGRNNGVAEELALKTNEIVRAKSNFLEGTYAVHGIEEVMTKKEAVIIIDPFEEEEKKFKDCLVNNVNMPVIAISDRNTGFPTVKIPEAGNYKEYVQLAAGWNLLVEMGISRGIDIDKPLRARKIGNEYKPKK